MGNESEPGLAPPAWRLPAEMHLGHVSLQVASLTRSLEYYERVLGLCVLERTEASVLLGTVEGRRGLVHLTERPGARPVGSQGRLGLYHYALLLPDRKALGLFIAHLGASDVRFGASDHLVSEAIYLHDPDGLGIEVYSDRPRSEWHSLNGQIQMASNPLDLDDLVRVAGAARWVGMPEGTSMGHVHLHVADLDQAIGFYHHGLGLDMMMWTYPGALFLGAGGYHHHLGLNTWAGPDAPRPQELDARLLEWRVVLPTRSDSQEAARGISSAGYQVASEGETFLATDPWGTRVRLV